MTRIEETLQKIAAATSKASSPTTSSTEPAPRTTLGDPNCPICGGIGFVRRDLPVGDPDFGKAQICSCRSQEVSQAIHRHLFDVSNLGAFKSFTFENFNVQGRLGLGDDQVSSLKLAFNHSRHFAQELKGWLLLLGGFGCGKTHLAAAIANYAVDMGVPTLFLTVPDLLDWLRFAYDSNETSFEDRFNEIRNVGLLVLDDLGTQSATPWAQEKLFQIINHRYVNRLPLVVNTNLDLAELDGRFRSRLQDPDLVSVVKITSPDYRLPTRDTTGAYVSSLTFLGGRTFGNFSMRESENLKPEEKHSLEKGFQAVQRFSENPHGWLVLTGPFASGKTHLAAAAANYRANMGFPPVFWVVPDLLDHLRNTFSPNSPVTYDRSFEEVKTASFLVLDDLGTQSTTPWAREKLFQLFNYRSIAELPTIITTSNSLDEIDARIRSRMLDGRLCAIYALLAPPYRGISSPEKPHRARKLPGR